jgi:hypothetical protein
VPKSGIPAVGLPNAEAMSVSYNVTLVDVGSPSATVRTVPISQYDMAPLTAGILQNLT